MPKKLYTCFKVYIWGKTFSSRKCEGRIKFGSFRRAPVVILRNGAIVEEHSIYEASVQHIRKLYVLLWPYILSLNKTTKKCGFLGVSYLAADVIRVAISPELLV